MAHLDEPPPIQEGLAKLEHLIEIGDEELKAKREEIRNDDSKTDEEKADELSQLGHKAQAWEDEEHPGMNRSAERWFRRSHLGIPEPPPPPEPEWRKAYRAHMAERERERAAREAAKSPAERAAEAAAAAAARARLDEENARREAEIKAELEAVEKELKESKELKLRRDQLVVKLRKAKAADTRAAIENLGSWMIPFFNSHVADPGQLGKFQLLSRSWLNASRAVCGLRLLEEFQRHEAWEGILATAVHGNVLARALADADINTQSLPPGPLQRAHMSAKHDRVIAAAAKAHGVRLANTCGAVIMRLVDANRGRVRCNGRLVEVKPLRQSQSSEDEAHPWGRFSIEYTRFTGDDLVKGEGEGHPMGVTLSFVKASTIACSWNFYAGKGAWLLINCNGGYHHVVDDFMADKELCCLRPPLPCDTPAKKTKLASQAATAIRVLEETTAFFLQTLQADFLEPGDRIAGITPSQVVVLRPSSSSSSSSAQQAQQQEAAAFEAAASYTFLPRCHNPSCGGLCPRRLTCSKCKRATYCSRECQRDSWPAHRRASVRERHGQMHEHRACVEPSVRAKHNAARWASLADSPASDF